jgi:hypothetical protein
MDEKQLLGNKSSVIYKLFNYWTLQHCLLSHDPPLGQGWYWQLPYGHETLACAFTGCIPELDEPDGLEAYFHIK